MNTTRIDFDSPPQVGVRTKYFLNASRTRCATIREPQIDVGSVVISSLHLGYLVISDDVTS